MRNKHLEELINRHPTLAVCEGDIVAAFETMCAAFRAGKKMLIAGNGGSAADAEHWSGELLKGFEDLRPLADDVRAKLPSDLAGKLQRALPVIPLTGFISLQTAFGNDVDPNLNIAQLLWALGEEGDVFVGITTSGNSENICLALQAAEAKGLVRIGLSGQTGGRMAGLTETCVCVPETKTRFVQELHLPIYHALCLMLEDEFFRS